MPDNPGQGYADSAYRGPRFRKAVAERGGVARMVATSVWSRSDEEAKANKIRSYGLIFHAVGIISPYTK
ncbi:MAG: hypothetical protein OIF56_00640 [Cohaesibacter sp.]|nr:hypothetical protein [Cohaesibacter sp.]MCV6601582.1 hypothetical protein [Cohaesibacter sp.]